jgi:hypothetical protein
LTQNLANVLDGRTSVWHKTERLETPRVTC